jgi:hypothetical protein
MSQGPVLAPPSPPLDPEPPEPPLEPELPELASLEPEPLLEVELPELELPEPRPEPPLSLLEPARPLDVEPPLEPEAAPELEPPPELEGNPSTGPEVFGAAPEPHAQRIAVAMAVWRVPGCMRLPLVRQCVLRKFISQLIAGRIVPLLVMSPEFVSHVAPSM